MSVIAVPPRSELQITAISNTPAAQRLIVQCMQEGDPSTVTFEGSGLNTPMEHDGPGRQSWWIVTFDEGASLTLVFQHLDGTSWQNSTVNSSVLVKGTVFHVFTFTTTGSAGQGTVTMIANVVYKSTLMP